jgi:hypothetical protein
LHDPRAGAFAKILVREADMPGRVMLSSVTKDDLPLGDIRKLKDFWYESETIPERLQQSGWPLKTGSRIDFTFARSEIQHHLAGKYGFEVYNFQNTATDGASPEKVTILETRRSHLVIGIFGSQTGWRVPDQDPLTPTFREWRAALESPLKFKVFVLKGALSVKMPPGLHDLVQDITNYKRGVIYQEFPDAVDLFTSVDRAVRDYVNKAVVRYAHDYAARQPTAETERWLMLPYRARVEEMRSALDREAQTLGVNQNLLTLGSAVQPVELHCVPDNFSIPESKKFAAYIFDDEVSTDASEARGRLHVVAAFGGITDLQVRRHLGNFEAAEVYFDSWGLYACVPGSGTQCVYLPQCVNSLVMQSKLSGAISWLNEHGAEITALAMRRRQILNLVSASAASANLRKAGSGRK